MAMSLCVRALRLTRAARPLLLGRMSCMARLAHTAHQPGTASVTGHKVAKLEEEEDDAIDVYLKNPDSFGYSEDPEADLWNARLVFFFGITICLVLGPIIVYYQPDPRNSEWSRREAERLVKLRESQGLPLIDKDYYDPSTLVLPPDDEE